MTEYCVKRGTGVYIINTTFDRCFKYSESRVSSMTIKYYATVRIQSSRTTDFVEQHKLLPLSNEFQCIKRESHDYIMPRPH